MNLQTSRIVQSLSSAEFMILTSCIECLFLQMCMIAFNCLFCLNLSSDSKQQELSYAQGIYCSATASSHRQEKQNRTLPCGKTGFRIGTLLRHNCALQSSRVQLGRRVIQQTKTVMLQYIDLSIQRSSQCAKHAFTFLFVICASIRLSHKERSHVMYIAIHIAMVGGRING